MEVQASAPAWDVIVVGAGAAGLACSRVLSAAGLRTLLLEARDRCGGRAWSWDALGLGVELDLGGAWLQSACAGNPVFRLAKERGLELLEDTTDTSFVADVRAGRLLDRKALKPYYCAVEEALGKVESTCNADEGEGMEGRSEEGSGRLGEQDGSANMTMMQALLSQGLPLHPEGQPEAGNGRGGRRKARKGQRKFDAHILRWALAWLLELDEGTSAEGLSALQLGANLPETNVVPVGGYGAFVRSLIKGPLGQVEAGEASLPQLELNVAVRRVEMEDSTLRSVRVHTEGGEVHCAQRVIIAVPLGVLKAGAIDFSPPLPQRKLDAIEHLGCANMAKVFLRFPRCFWKDEVSGWSICGLPVDQPESVFERAWFFPYPLRPCDVPDGEGVLCILLCGQAARDLERLSDEAASAAAVKALRTAAGCDGTKQFFVEPSGKLPEPTAVSLSRWHLDPWSLCCWTAFKPGSSAADCSALAEPLGERRWMGFAGEHTTADDMGTVHGAFLTGLREAEGVLLACMEDGCFASGKAMVRAARWLLYCRDALAAARAVREHDEECDSDSSSSSSS